MFAPGPFTEKVVDLASELHVGADVSSPKPAGGSGITLPSAMTCGAGARPPSSRPTLCSVGCPVSRGNSFSGLESGTGLWMWPRLWLRPCSSGAPHAAAAGQRHRLPQRNAAWAPALLPGAARAWRCPSQRTALAGPAWLSVFQQLEERSHRGDRLQPGPCRSGCPCQSNLRPCLPGL